MEFILDAVSDYSLAIPPRVVNESILKLQLPIFEYVSKTIPEEYDSSFQDMDTWVDLFSDLMMYMNNGIPTSSSTLSDEDTISLRRRVLGNYKPIIVTDFRRTVSIVIIVVVLLFLIKEDNSLLTFTIDKINDNKKKIVRKAVKALFKKYEKKLKKDKERPKLFENTRDVKYLD